MANHQRAKVNPERFVPTEYPWMAIFDSMTTSQLQDMLSGSSPCIERLSLVLSHDEHLSLTDFKEVCFIEDYFRSAPYPKILPPLHVDALLAEQAADSIDYLHSLRILGQKIKILFLCLSTKKDAEDYIFSLEQLRPLLQSVSSLVIICVDQGPAVLWFDLDRLNGLHRKGSPVDSIREIFLAVLVSCVGKTLHDVLLRYMKDSFPVKAYLPWNANFERILQEEKLSETENSYSKITWKFDSSLGSPETFPESPFSLFVEDDIILRPEQHRGLRMLHSKGLVSSPEGPIDSLMFLHLEVCNLAWQFPNRIHTMFPNLWSLDLDLSGLKHSRRKLDLTNLAYLCDLSIRNLRGGSFLAVDARPCTLLRALRVEDVEGFISFPPSLSVWQLSVEGRKNQVIFKDFKQRALHVYRDGKLQPFTDPLNEGEGMMADWRGMRKPRRVRKDEFLYDRKPPRSRQIGQRTRQLGQPFNHCD